MVSLATSDQREDLEKLWQLGFGDDSDYTGVVFDHLLEPGKVLMYAPRRGEKPQAMLCMEPMDLVAGGRALPAVYLYAFTVHPDARGGDLGRELLRGYDNYCKKKGYAASVLKPATPELFSYYRHREYEELFEEKRWALDGDAVSDLRPAGGRTTLIPRTLENLFNMRNAFFGEQAPYARWEPSYLAFVDREIRLRGGEVLLADHYGEKGYLVYRQGENQVEIIEWAVPPSHSDNVLWALHQRLQADRYVLRLPADYPLGERGQVLPFAMIKWYDTEGVSLGGTKAPYLTYVMD